MMQSIGNGAFMALGTSLGAWWASRWSVKKGERVIRMPCLLLGNHGGKTCGFLSS